MSACSSNTTPQDDLQVAATLVAATPAVSPELSAAPAGTRLALPGKATAAVVDPATRTLAVAVEAPAELLLFHLDQLSAAPVPVPLPGRADHLELAGGGGQLLVPMPSQPFVLHVVLPGGSTTRWQLNGGAADGILMGGRTVAARADGTGVTVLDGDQVQRTIGGFRGAAVVVPDRNQVVVLDRLRTAVTEVNPVTGQLGTSLRAGDGATNAVVDRFGRVLVTDTRGGELLAFSAGPLLMRQRYPVPGVPYALAYDSRRDLVWVTLTERNEVVGYYVAGGEPVERYRFPTVRQPNAVAVDPESGRVFVASADGGGVQVVQP
jgi:DNA-binding beta-propeller fold protein YncE